MWGDDESTEIVDGFRDGEVFTLSVLGVNSVGRTELDVVTALDGGMTYKTDGLTVIESGNVLVLPAEYSLSPAYPNPFNAVTSMSYFLPIESLVTIRIYDTAGRLTSTIADATQPEGSHTATWNGNRASSGIYFVKMESGGFSVVRKVVLVR